jgi:hypothetical protein
MVEGVFPNDPQNQAAADEFNVGLGLINGVPIVSNPPENLDLFFNNITGQAVVSRVMRDAGFVTVASSRAGSTGYVSKSPNPETNYVNLGNGAGGGSLKSAYMFGAEFKVTITYVVIADIAASNLQLAINQARPSVQGA